jgi:GTP pyrophosphokinase/guanosine-3',5'-bis(diphosphate) 3'-pyrophosphohydrolase
MNRTEFLNKISLFATESSVANIEIAYLMAKKFHDGQTRKELDQAGNPLRYFEHLRRTALILIDEFGVKTPELIITALLHDMIEDSEDGRLASLLIQRLFGDRVYQNVSILSKLHKDSYISNLTEYSQSYPQILLVKAADRLDNLRSLPDDPEFCRKQYAETREVYLPLFAAASQNSVAALTAYRKISECLK